MLLVTINQRSFLHQRTVTLRMLNEQRHYYTEGLLRVGIELMRQHHGELFAAVREHAVLHIDGISMPYPENYHGKLMLFKHDDVFILQALLHEADRVVCSYSCEITDHGKYMEVNHWQRNIAQCI